MTLHASANVVANANGGYTALNSACTVNIPTDGHPGKDVPTCTVTATNDLTRSEGCAAAITLSSVATCGTTCDEDVSGVPTTRTVFCSVTEVTLGGDLDGFTRHPTIELTGVVSASGVEAVVLAEGMVTQGELELTRTGVDYTSTPIVNHAAAYGADVFEQAATFTVTGQLEYVCEEGGSEASHGGSALGPDNRDDDRDDVAETVVDAKAAWPVGYSAATRPGVVQGCKAGSAISHTIVFEHPQSGSFGTQYNKQAVNGYKQTPVCTLANGNSDFGDRTDASFVARGRVVSIDIENTGDFYVRTPTAALHHDEKEGDACTDFTCGAKDLAGAGEWAASTAAHEEADLTVRMRLQHAIIVNQGEGYTAEPTVTLAKLSKAQRGDTANAVESIAVTAGGAGYVAVPAVTISFVGGESNEEPHSSVFVQATATAVLDGDAVTAINVDTKGYGYYEAPIITIAAPPEGGVQATASATVSSSQAWDPKLDENVPGTGAELKSSLDMAAAGGDIVIAGGSTASSGDGGSVTVSGGSPTDGQAGHGGDLSFTVATAKQKAAPVWEMDTARTWCSQNSEAWKMQGTWTADCYDGAENVQSLSHVVVLLRGSGYTAVPSVTITPSDGTTPLIAATATAVMGRGTDSMFVQSIQINRRGTGYTAAPTITIAAPGGTGTTATAVAFINNGDENAGGSLALDGNSLEQGGTGADITVQGGDSAGNNAGGDVRVLAQGTDVGNGGSISLKAGSAQTSGSGGDVIFTPGLGFGEYATRGGRTNIYDHTGDASTGEVQVWIGDQCGEGDDDCLLATDGDWSFQDVHASTTAGSSAVLGGADGARLRFFATDPTDADSAAQLRKTLKQTGPSDAARLSYDGATTAIPDDRQGMGHEVYNVEVTTSQSSSSSGMLLSASSTESAVDGYTVDPARTCECGDARDACALNEWSILTEVSPKEFLAVAHGEECGDAGLANGVSVSRSCSGMGHVSLMQEGLYTALPTIEVESGSCSNDAGAANPAACTTGTWTGPESDADKATVSVHYSFVGTGATCTTWATTAGGVDTTTGTDSDSCVDGVDPLLPNWYEGRVLGDGCSAKCGQFCEGETKPIVCKVDGVKMTASGKDYPNPDITVTANGGVVATDVQATEAGIVFEEGAGATAAGFTSVHRTPGCALNSLDAQDQVHVDEFNTEMVKIANNIEKIAYFINTQLRPLALSNKANFNALMNAMSPDTGVKAVTVVDNGAGYVEQPTVTFAAPVAGGRAATGYAVLSSNSCTGLGGCTVSEVVVTDPGTGYTKIQSIEITNAGSGYSTAAGAVTLSISPPAGLLSGGSRGEQAAASVTVAPDGTIASVTITNAGSGYTEDPIVTISTGSGTTAVLVASRSPAVSVSHDDGDTEPTEVALLSSSVDVGHGLLKQCSNGDITIRGFRMTNGGSDFTADSVVAVTVSHPKQVPETLCPTEADPAATCGYTAPSVVATGEAVVDAETGKVTGITLTNAGTGYRSLGSVANALPVVSITDSASTGVGATAIMEVTCGLQ
jgi:hypothetical protein